MIHLHSLVIRWTVLAQNVVAHLTVIARALPDSPVSPKTPKNDVDVESGLFIIFWQERLSLIIIYFKNYTWKDGLRVISY